MYVQEGETKDHATHCVRQRVCLHVFRMVLEEIHAGQGDGGNFEDSKHEWIVVVESEDWKD